MRYVINGREAEPVVIAAKDDQLAFWSPDYMKNRIRSADVRAIGFFYRGHLDKILQMDQYEIQQREIDKILYDTLMGWWFYSN